VSGVALRTAWAGETLELLPERALWWPAERTLFVADVHLGKDQVFRRFGIGVPGGPTEADLTALTVLVERRAAQRLVILGDLVHAPPAPGDRWPASVAGWRRNLAGVELRLVLGNHDRRLEPWLADWGLEASRGSDLGPFALAHEPADAPARPTLCGHLHPVVKLREGRHGSLRLPVFWFSARLGVLPAFGAFTGGQLVTPAPGDAVHAIARSAVVTIQGPAGAECEER